MNERDMLLKKIGTYKFAIVDIDIFLDTHPGDSKMLALRNQYEEELKPLVKKFEAKYGPLTKRDTETNTWTWVKDPWPWDMEA
ncbi:MAG: spore coat protein CotJB [Ruminococcus sp.]|nr:spore coat protein CotJB [Ruminococcus sp.]MBQ9516199.1 spore coat protein CotJB [Ruminococcus sp.]